MPGNRKPRKRYVPRQVDIDPMGTAHALASFVPQHRQAALAQPLRNALQVMRSGGSTDAWRALADGMNVAERLADLSVGRNLLPEIVAAQEALATVHTRHAATGSWTLRGPEITALHEGVVRHIAQLQVCTQGELVRAITKVQQCVSQALAGNASPRALVCSGALGASPATSRPTA
jgi:hypothetical protein